MSITLTYGGVTLDLPEDLAWVDEYDWQAVEQTTSYSVTGALLREATAKKAGQPVTLTGAADAAWIDRGTLDTLEAWKRVPGRVMTLHLRAVDRSVVWDHAAAIKAEPIVPFSDPEPDDRYIVTFRFITVPTPAP